MSSASCNAQTRWPHAPAQNWPTGGTLGRVITGRSAPDYNIRYDNPYQTPASQNMPACGPLGRVIIGRSSPEYNVRYDNPYQGARQNPVIVDMNGSNNNLSSMNPTQQKLSFDAGSFAIGILVGIVGGAFIYTLTGRQICEAIGKRAKRKIERH
jgi:hypothetical protein